MQGYIINKTFPYFLEARFFLCVQSPVINIQNMNKAILPAKLLQHITSTIKPIPEMRLYVNNTLGCRKKILAPLLYEILISLPQVLP